MVNSNLLVCSFLLVWTLVSAQYPIPVLRPLPMHKYQVESSVNGDLICPPTTNLTALTLARQGTIVQYSALKEARTFEDFEAGMRRLWDAADKNIKSIVPSAGTYTGIEEIIEYITLVVGSLNHGYVYFYNATTRDFVYFPNNASYSFISPQKSKFNCQKAPSNSDSGECETDELDSLSAHHISFKPCTALIKQYVIEYDNTQNYMALKGGSPVTVCARHNQFCKGENKQFKNFIDCMKFMERIPSVSCESEVLNGNSVACRFKHSFMLRFRPSVHCSHVGRNSTPCTDESCGNLSACDGKPGDATYTPRLSRKCCTWKKYRNVNTSKCPLRLRALSGMK